MDLPVKMNLSAPNVVNVCVDRRSSEACTGRLYCRYTEESIPFQNEYHLLKILEELMDRIGYPQSSVEMRSYRKKDRVFGELPGIMIRGEEIFRKEDGWVLLLFMSDTGRTPPGRATRPGWRRER